MIEVRAYAKHYRTGGGVGPLDLTFASGEIAALIGPNGAGKTTFFNLLNGVVPIDGGTLLFDGAPFPRLPLARVGYLPSDPFLMARLTGRQSCRLDAALRGLTLSEEDVEAALAVFDCLDFSDRRIGSLSQGMVKRVALSRAFMGDPAAILLDEPTNSIDVQTAIALKDVLVERRRAGACILISSHSLEFVDEVATRMLFLRDGFVVEEIDPGSVRAEDAYRSIFLDKTACPPAK